MTRLAGAIQAVREAVASASDIPIRLIDPEADLLSDLRFNRYEFESLGLIIEEVFSIPLVPDDLFKTPLHRSCEALAEWCILRSLDASWNEARRQRRA